MFLKYNSSCYLFEMNVFICLFRAAFISSF